MMRILAASLLILVAGTALAGEDKVLELKLRKREETSPGSGRFHALVKPAQWEAGKTAVIVCDMWDLHHCLNATRRGGEMAPRVDAFLKNLRDRGATVIHAPSSCMDAYKEHPSRKRAQAVPRAKNLPAAIGEWCHRIPSEEKGTYPIDQSDGGEDDDLKEHQAWAKKLAGLGRDPRAPWKSQMEALTIDPARDFVSDSGEEIWSILDQRGIDQVILVGVHTNMCVLGRPFGLRQMAKNGKNVVLVRDLTDTMYNPARPPHVSHFTGTDLIIEHIEKWVCPTITSDQILGGKPFRFSGDKRPHVVVLMAEDEYKTEKTLPPFALANLGKSCQVSLVFAADKSLNDLPGLDVVNDADVLLVSVRRRVLPPRQLALIRKHIEAGKPVVGIRTASHAFSLREGKTPEGMTAWPEFDAQVFAGNYQGHHKDGPTTTVQATPEGQKHPILKGVDTANWTSEASLYRVRPLGKTATVLLTGSIEGQEAEPIAWINAGPNGNRVFYTSLGHESDFKKPAFAQMLRNAVLWAAGTSAPAE
ncbi:MAG: isochorismatase family protein [Gemmataceae bacterium]